MSIQHLIATIGLCLVMANSPAVAEEIRYKPYILGTSHTGSVEQVATAVRAALKAQGFTEVGSYSPYPGARVIVVTSPELLTAAARVRYGGFGAGQRVAVTESKGSIQVSYVNPAYLAAAYGLGDLGSVPGKLQTALGATQAFGSEAGFTAAELAPGTYHYMVGMPYFHQVDVLAEYPTYAATVAAVEKGLSSGNGGTRKVYRIDLPGQEISVFGVAIVTGDGVNRGEKDSDRELMDILDWQHLRHTAYLPYEILVQGNRAIALRGRYRIALHFPDTRMAGPHGFTRIMNAPSGIKSVLMAVAEGDRKSR